MTGYFPYSPPFEYFREFSGIFENYLLCAFRQSRNLQSSARTFRILFFEGGLLSGCLPVHPDHDTALQQIVGEAALGPDRERRKRSIEIHRMGLADANYSG